MSERAGVLEVAGACHLPVPAHLRLQLCLILLNELITVSLRCEVLFRALDCGQVLVWSFRGCPGASCGRLIWRFVGWWSLISLVSLVKRCPSVGFNPLLLIIHVQTTCVVIFLIWGGRRWRLGERWAANWLVGAQASGCLFHHHHLLLNRISPLSHRGRRYLGWYLTQQCMHILRCRCCFLLMLNGDKWFKGCPLTPQLWWHLLPLSWHEGRDLIKVKWHLLAELLLLLNVIHLLKATRIAIRKIARKQLLWRASYLEGGGIEGLAVGDRLG